MPSNAPIGMAYLAPNGAAVQLFAGTSPGDGRTLHRVWCRQGALMMLAGHLRIERRIGAVRIIPEDPEVLLIVGLPSMRFVHFGRGIVLEQRIGSAVEGRRRLRV